MGEQVGVEMRAYLALIFLLSLLYVVILNV